MLDLLLRFLGVRYILGDFWELHRVAVDAVGPRPVGVGCRLDALPRHAVAVEAGAEGDHPHPVALLHHPLGLDVRQLVQHRAAGRVPEPVQRHPGRLHVLVGEAEASLDLVDHPAAACVDAEVLERRPEVGTVEPHLGAPAEELPLEEGERDEELLRGRQDEGAEGGDVALERVAGGGGEVLGEADPCVALVVLLLEHAPVVGVPRGRHGAHRAGELEPRPLRRVGEDHGGGAHAEEAVGEQHGALGANVVLRREDLRGHDEDVRARAAPPAGGSWPGPTETSPALHPIPDRLTFCTSARSLYLLTTMSAKTGVGVNMLQLTMSTSMSSGLTVVLAKTSSTAEKMTSSVSSREALRPSTWRTAPGTTPGAGSSRTRRGTRPWAGPRASAWRRRRPPAAPAASGPAGPPAPAPAPPRASFSGARRRRRPRRRWRGSCRRRACTWSGGA
ncbi:hypothetical protein PVAP13_5NG388181 [Panicum virgatum]|uniref:Uncharacterized protein n=1 Tax=Panicum virgatum TaxID=38727 RepID=A0A8T0RWZ6_PANVG|nr:hypothetical protein PVAP13_5NG388181 [Panicum virgatum]